MMFKVSHLMSKASSSLILGGCRCSAICCAGSLQDMFVNARNELHRLPPDDRATALCRERFSPFPEHLTSPALQC